MRDFGKACAVCGENWHREWQCDKDKLVTFQSKVSCQICGDGGHPTIDCPQKHSGTDLGQGKVLDKEYLSFLEELNDGLGSAASAPPPATFSGKMPLPSSQASVHGIGLPFWLLGCMYLVCLLFITTSHLSAGMLVSLLQPLLIV
jgi:hypothetical protein